MRVESEETLDLFRTPGKCEVCGRWSPRRVPHHIFFRGMGGGGRLDVPKNLIAVGGDFDCPCHAEAQAYRIKRDDLLDIVARREGCTREDCVEEVYRLRRTPK